MTFLEIMQSYFHGEKLEAFYFILPGGILLVILGVTAIKAEHGGFAWGVAVPAILMGLILIGTGIGVGARTNGQLAALEQSYQENPVTMVETELPRMEKVNANFKLTFIVFGIMAAAGLGIHYLGGANLGRGLGATLILLGVIGLLVDGFAERRAEPYTTALKDLVAEQVQ